MYRKNKVGRNGHRALGTFKSNSHTGAWFWSSYKSHLPDPYAISSSWEYSVSLHLALSVYICADRRFINTDCIFKRLTIGKGDFMQQYYFQLSEKYTSRQVFIWKPFIKEMLPEQPVLELQKRTAEKNPSKGMILDKVSWRVALTHTLQGTMNVNHTTELSK